ncbi:MAG: hypothetical protein LBD25_00200 [Coriobacteriales bacterium]|jgi:uncharacterized Zn finger protein (UPF0148 family)|nr:hypothetical protein [Coriobacteriales bacterium]
MPAVEVTCSQCGSSEYRLADAKTGEVFCVYCRNKWIVPELVQLSETEKFLEAQAKRPQVVYDNTSETDRQLMDIVSGAVRTTALNPLRSLGRVVRVIVGIVVMVVLAAACSLGLPFIVLLFNR